MSLALARIEDPAAPSNMNLTCFLVPVRNLAATKGTRLSARLLVCCLLVLVVPFDVMAAHMAT
jgi:hypothetical protein